MNKAIKFINDLQIELSETELEGKILSALLDCWDKLKNQIKNEELYSIGVYSGNMDFSCVTFSANTNIGLIEKIQQYKEDEYYLNKSDEEIRLSIKWNSADWKYHDIIFSDAFEKANDILGGITERMYNIEEYKPILNNLTEENIGQICVKKGPLFEGTSDNLSYDLYKDIYDPGYELIYTTIKNSLIEFKKQISFTSDVVVGMFCGDASYDFMIKNCIPINGKTSIKSIINDLRHLGELHDLNYLEEDYHEFEN
ncbi:MAG: DUF4303 domain-containing protein [Saprospiraceae bacterium]|nr:DUF4303 domain-containing protein [Saprospiraceae bacterium]MBK9632242.1 DUF4303 domain-containing protein [Saprospiraceae bacterium]